METSIIHLDGKPVVIKMSDFGDEIDADELTRINYENIYGDAVTVSALLNKIGVLRAHAESVYDQKALEVEFETSRLKKQFRREAIEDGGHISIEGVRIKLTEKSLDDAVNLDKGLQVMRKNVVKAKENFGKIESLYWGVQSKDKKLNNLISGVTEEELWNSLVDGKVNGLLIKKKRSIVERNNRLK